ncbi:MAG: STAS domain-containing protein [Acidobacteriia bacterium]|nr:STAS domain-containing protein [Terriglobia bacterium]
MIIQFTKRSLQPGITVFEIIGSINAGPECAKLEREVVAKIAAGETRVIFDMAGVTHADSAAIGALVKCLTKLKKAGGALRIASAQPMIAYSLQLTKVDKLIEMFASVDEAASGFGGPGHSAAP